MFSFLILCCMWETELMFCFKPWASDNERFISQKVNVTSQYNLDCLVFLDGLQNIKLDFVPLKHIKGWWCNAFRIYIYIIWKVQARERNVWKRLKTDKNHLNSFLSSYILCSTKPLALAISHLLSEWDQVTSATRI